MNILVTGGCGFIGSHCVVELLNNNYNVIIIDNFSNSDISVLDKIAKINNKEVKFYEGDVRDTQILTKIFNENEIDAVIHFAGFKAVGESVAKPMMYYDNNLKSTIALVEVMEKFNCKTIVFSSSATVYGDPHKLPITEDFPLSTTNPYGSTKLMTEMMLTDLYNSDNSWSINILRYFNPIGAHESGYIGENPKDIPNNLMPYIIKVASKQLECLTVFGNDYDTHDGTGVRDYIHVVDLADGHVKAIKTNHNNAGLHIYNLGTGIGYSVLDLINNFEKENNIKLNYKIGPRRDGDIAANYADSSKALTELGWSAKYNINDMCKHAYNFIEKNK